MKKFIEYYKNNKNKCTAIGILIFVFILLICMACGNKNETDKKEKNVKVEVQQEYLKDEVNINGILGGYTSLDESKSDSNKVYDWVEKLRNDKTEGLQTLNTSKHTYVYVGANTDEKHAVGFTYGDKIEDSDKITFNININTYNVDDGKNKNTYAAILFAIDKTDKQIVLNN